MNINKKMLGNIESISSTLITGWVESLTAENHALFCIDCGASVRDFSPALPRPDVAEVHARSSVTGFQINLNKQIAIKHSGHRFDIRQGNARLMTGEFYFADYSVETVTYIYVCELFDYLTGQPHVSGIQRYVLDILEELYNSSEHSNFKVVSFDVHAHEFYEITKSLLEQLLEDYSSARPLARIAQRIKDYAIYGVVHPTEGDNLICLGALWGVPSADEAIRRLVERGVRFIPFVYDLIPLLSDSMHTSDTGVIEVFSQYINYCCRFASSIASLSVQTKTEFDNWSEKFFGVKIPGAVIGAIPRDLSAHPHRFELPHELLPGKYILQVGTLEPRKRHLLSVRTFVSMIDSNQDCDLKLVIVGRKGWRMENDWGVIEDAIQTGKVILYEDLHDLQLNGLYANARFTVFPSSYEGWGLPISESLLVGVPCLTTGKGAMLEAGGIFATYFRDDSHFVELFEKLSLDDEFNFDQRKKASGYDLGKISSPLTNLTSLVKFTTARPQTQSPKVKLAKEYSFRFPSGTSASGKIGSNVSPFLSAIPTLDSYTESHRFLLGFERDPVNTWLTKNSELSFCAPSNEELWVLIAANSESNGNLSIHANSTTTRRYVNEGLNLLSFCVMPSSLGDVKIKFDHQGVKTDARLLEVGLDSLLVTKVSDVRTRELSLHNWINSGKFLAEFHRS